MVWEALANRAARRLAPLRVQNNELTLAEAGQFQGRKFLPSAFLQCSRLPAPCSIARARHQAEATGDSRVERSSLRGKPFNLKETFAAIWPSGIVPPSIIESEFLERLR